ncbi:predicted protein [Sclerotinia sclerotiorum 1980 UF-70]|uniref:Uncharacterized protein n=1 Tax=Sclerotinia sclerotiorum (strain ATCC 18683 / 1980 / Ss-1) TaxID=665079 RepID=A7E8M7_SCLS1|nr:predicted protein [Sclerotinia sclerotiorum 1980 UF-70]EDN96729.1 predicted protein [Sclerotinia sclerotiorum 1980 UF-70]
MASSTKLQGYTFTRVKLLRRKEVESGLTLQTMSLSDLFRLLLKPPARLFIAFNNINGRLFLTPVDKYITYIPNPVLPTSNSS